jgi:hypothetical protein
MMLVGIALAVLSVLMLVALLALVDQHQSLEAVRRHLNSTTTPQGIAYENPGVSLASLGLPARLDDLARLNLLFLSTSCTACQSLAGAMRRAPRENLWIVVDAPTLDQGNRWLSAVGLDDGIATVDDTRRIASAYGIAMAPAVVVLREGEPLVAQTVPSYEHLEPLLLTRELPPFLTEATEEASAT